MACVTTSQSVHKIHPHDLARDLHSAEPCVLVDCRPVLAFNTCHISGAVNVNFTGMMKKRFLAGKISLADLVTTEEGREKFRTCVQQQRTVVYDEDTCDPAELADSHALVLVITALSSMGRNPYVLQGKGNTSPSPSLSVCVSYMCLPLVDVETASTQTLLLNAHMQLYDIHFQCL